MLSVAPMRVQMCRGNSSFCRGNSSFSFRSFPLLTSLIIFVLLNINHICESALDSQKNEDLFTWARAHGAEIDSFEMAEFPDTGRGAGVLQTINPADVFIRIPLRICIYNETIVGSPLEPLLGKVNIQLAITAFLIYEKLKGKDSFWKPFLDILPKTYETPNFWTKNLLAELQDESLLEELEHDNEFIRSEYEVLQKLMRELNIPNRKKYTFDLYEWALATSRTRSFGLPEVLMAPIADLVNYKSTSQVSFGLDPNDSKYFVMQNLGGETYQRGEEVFLNYGGDHSIFDTFSRYGMIQENEKQGHLPVYIGDKAFKLRFQVKGIHVMRFFRSLIQSFLDEDEKPETRDISKRSTKSLIVIEQQAAALCSRLIRQLLRQKKTHLREDLAKLRTLKTFSKMKLAVMYRLEMKKVLHRNVAFCDGMKEELACFGPKASLDRPRYTKSILKVEVHANSGFHEGLTYKEEES